MCKIKQIKTKKLGIVIISLLLQLPLWTGCTSIVPTSGKNPLKNQLEATAVSGWNDPKNMRELGSVDMPIINLGLSKAASRFEENLIADKSGNCPSGTVPYLSTQTGRNIVKKKIVASGYGAPPTRRLSDMQKRLLSLRAAKLDAIRTLSERVSGIQIWGGATMQDFAIKSDRIHVQLDTFIRGARMISSNYMDDGTYEAIMEINFNSSLLRRLKMNRCLPEGQIPETQISRL